VPKIKLTPAQEITKRFVQAIDSLVGVRNGERITLLKISEELNMHSSNITRLKTSVTHAPTIDACYLLCKKYGISPSWLLMGTGTMAMEVKELPVDILDKLEEFKEEIKRTILAQSSNHRTPKPSKLKAFR